jgi:hypothetical protein
MKTKYNAILFLKNINGESEMFLRICSRSTLLRHKVSYQIKYRTSLLESFLRRVFNHSGILRHRAYTSNHCLLKTHRPLYLNRICREQLINIQPETISKKLTNSAITRRPCCFDTCPKKSATLLWDLQVHNETCETTRQWKSYDLRPFEPTKPPSLSPLAQLIEEPLSMSFPWESCFLALLGCIWQRTRSSSS